MSLKLVLIKTKSEAESLFNIDPENMVYYSENDVIQVAIGKIDDSCSSTPWKHYNVWIGEKTCIEVSYKHIKNEPGKIDMIWFDIGGDLDLIRPYLTNVKNKLGGQFFNWEANELVEVSKL